MGVMGAYLYSLRYELKKYQIKVVFDMASCNFVDGYQYFGETYNVYLQDRTNFSTLWMGAAGYFATSAPIYKNALHQIS
jgi:hypothetical protein